MKKISCAVLLPVVVLAILQTVSAQIQGQWASTGSMQSARELNAQVRMSSGRVLSVGGVDNSGNVSRTAGNDLMPRATILMGFNIGFLFQNDTAFEKGVVEFNKQHPSLIMDLGDHLRLQRSNWQNGLSKFRNHFLEHRKEEQTKFAKYYQPGQAEVLFDSVWRTMADIFPVFIESHFPSSFSIEEIPVNDRVPIMRRRFRFVRLGAPPAPSPS